MTSYETNQFASTLLLILFVCIVDNFLFVLSMLFAIKTNFGKQIGYLEESSRFCRFSLSSAFLSFSALLCFLDGASTLVNFS